MSENPPLQCECGVTAFVDIRFSGAGMMSLTCFHCRQTMEISMSVVMGERAWEAMEREAPEPIKEGGSIGSLLRIEAEGATSAMSNSEKPEQTWEKIPVERRMMTTLPADWKIVELTDEQFLEAMKRKTPEPTTPTTPTTPDPEKPEPSGYKYGGLL